MKYIFDEYFDHWKVKNWFFFSFNKCHYINTAWNLIVLHSLYLYLLNFSNGIIHVPFLKLSIIIFKDIKVRTSSWPASNISLVRLYRSAGWLYTVGKDLLLLPPLYLIKSWKGKSWNDNYLVNIKPQLAEFLSYIYME